MRKLILILMALVFVPIAFAQNTTVFSKPYAKISGSILSLVMQNYDGLTMFKDYTNAASMNLDYSVNINNVPPVSAANFDATHPGTYCDSSGNVLTKTSGNFRITYGYYNETGFISMKGVMIESDSTNLLTYSADFSNGAWTPTNGSVGSDSVTLPSGSTDTKNTFTASNSNATLLQSVTSASSSKTFSVWLKRKTGTGTVSVTSDNSNWSACTLYSDKWVRCQTNQTSTNPSVGIKIAISGDAVYIWGAQLEVKDFATSYIPTTSASLGRYCPDFRHTTAYGNVNGQYGSGVAVGMVFGKKSTGDIIFRSDSGSTTYNWINILPTSVQYNWGTAGLYRTQTVTISTFAKYMYTVTFNGTNTQGYLNDGSTGSTAGMGVPFVPSAGSTCVGYAPASCISQWEGIISYFAMFNRVLSSTEISSLYTLLLSGT